MPHSMQNKLPMPGETYVSPDNLRDTATRMFARNQQDRASFNLITTTPQQHQHQQQQQQQHQQHYTNGHDQHQQGTYRQENDY